MRDDENKEIEMVISARFRPRGLTPEKYDEAIRRLEETGHGTPAGRPHHVAVEADREVEVYDVWEWEEALEAWGPQGFVPVLPDLGVELGPRRSDPCATSSRRELSVPRWLGNSGEAGSVSERIVVLGPRV